MTAKNQRTIAKCLYVAGTGVGDVDGPSIVSTLKLIKLFQNAIVDSMKRSYIDDDGRKMSYGLWDSANDTVILLLMQEAMTLPPGERVMVFSEKLNAAAKDKFPSGVKISEDMMFPAVYELKATGSYYLPGLFTDAFLKVHDKEELFDEGSFQGGP